MRLAHCVQRLFRAGLLIVALICALGTTSNLHAQAGMQMVGGPLPTKRHERLLRAYVQPTPDEASAIDRLHEVYLDGFRTELDPQIAAITKSMSAMPTEQEFKKFLRDTERLQTRIDERDNAFIDSAAAIMPEDRRGGFARLREARERQRELSGLTRFGPMLIGASGSFVDVADLLIRDACLKSVAAESRASFDAILRSQEQRTLMQARNYNNSTRKAFESFVEAMLAVQAKAAAGGEGADDGAESMAMMAEIQQRTGADTRKLLSANFDANRTACAEFASVLPARALLDLRCELATKSMGMLSFAVAQSPDPRQDLLQLVSRIGRDRSITDETKRALEAIADAWRSARATSLEEIAAIALHMDMATLMASAGAMYGQAPNEDDAGDDQGKKILRAQKSLQAATQTALAAIKSALGADAEKYVSYTQIDRGNGEAASWVYNQIPEVATARGDGSEGSGEETSDDASEVQRGFNGIAFLYNAPAAIDARQVTRILALYGVDANSSAVIEQTVEAWRAREHDAKVAVIGTEVSTLARKMWVLDPETGEARQDAAVLASLAAARRRLILAIFEADAALGVDLATALGVPTDGPEILALRLEHLDLVNEGSMGGDSFQILIGPSRAIERAKVNPEIARALLEGDAAVSWRTLVAEFPTLAQAQIERQKAVEDLQNRFTGDNQTEHMRLGEMQAKLMRERTNAGRAVRAKVDAAFKQSCAAISSDTEAQQALRFAWKHASFPNLFKNSECATTQLAQAMQLEGLSEDQLAKLDALKAEYDAVYEAISDTFIEKSMGLGAMYDADTWREQQANAEEAERLRFQRKERTDKVRSEARRILGDERAARVRGLVPSDDPAVSNARRNPYQMFGEADED